MKSFDSDENMKYILDELKKTDTFYGLFKKEFSESIIQIIQKFFPDTMYSEEIDNLLQAYAVAILNATEAVIDKDRNYPGYRLEEELEAMNRITLKLSRNEEYADFAETIHLMAKKMIVKTFNFIYDLSSNGFRLLEHNSRLYNREFVSAFLEVLSSKNSSSDH
jgi:hypothetical protein